MPLLDRLTFLIDADGRRATAEFNRVGKAAKETLSIGQQFGRDFTKGLGVGAGALSGFVAADALRQLATFSIASARAAEDDARAQVVLAKTLQVAAGSTYAEIRAVEDFISTTSDAVGVVDDELRPALSTLVRSTNDAATAQRLLSLSLDISAGTGRDVNTVATALAKAWEGQTTALGRLLPEVGGLIREGATAQQVFRQLETTFGGTAKETANQAGAFSRLRVSASELSEEYGRNLAPAVKGLSTSVGLLRKELAAPLGTGPTQGLAGALLKFTSAVNAPNAIGGLIGGTGRSMKEFQALMVGGADATDELKRRLDAIADGSGMFSARLRELGFGMKGFNVGLGITTSSVVALEDSLRALASVASSAFSEIFALSGAEDRFADALDNTSSSAGGAARATRDLVAEQFQLERSARTVLQAELDLLDAEKTLENVRKGASDREKKRAGLDVTEAQNRVKQAQQRIAEAVTELNRASGRRGNPADAARARQELTDALLEEERAREDLIDTEERANETMRRGTQGSEELADATKRVEDAQWNLREAIEAQRTSAMVDETDGGPVGRSVRQQRDAFKEAATAAGDIIQQMIAAGAPTDAINTKIAEMVLKLQAAGTAAGVTQEEIQKTADLLIAFGALGQAEQQRSLAGIYGFGYSTLREELDAMRRQGIYVPDIAYQLAGGRAGGGSVNAGSRYKVGERGAETLTMGNSPGWITPNGGGGMTINFNGTVVADKPTLEALVVDALNSARRRGYSNN